MATNRKARTRYRVITTRGSTNGKWLRSLTEARRICRLWNDATRRVGKPPNALIVDEDGVFFNVGC